MTDYDIIASHFSHTRKYVWEDIKPFLDIIEPKSRVLDLGCGNGRILQELKTKQIDYLGIDQSKKLLKMAEKHYPSYTFKYGDITKTSTFKGLKEYAKKLRETTDFAISTPPTGCVYEYTTFLFGFTKVLRYLPGSPNYVEEKGRKDK